MTGHLAALRPDNYLDQFCTEFGRCDRRRWAAIYVQGLLSTAGRKTVGGLARHTELPNELGVEDVTQALQNFVNQSPWDERLVWRRNRQLIRERAAEGVLMLNEVAFVKQGRHSVGVQRQYSNALAGKFNCQIAVVLSHAGPDGVYPLAMRLYLPRSWLQTPERLDVCGVPAAHRVPQSRGTIGLELLEETRSDGWPMFPVVVGPGFNADDSLRDELGPRWIDGLETSEDDGRSRLRGWAAQARLEQERLFDELGLSDFEGRSWRGFHHHACLVMVACGFQLLNQPPP
jgi:SRSO17 transposase